MWILAMIAGGEAGYLDGKVMLEAGHVEWIGPFGVLFVCGILLVSWRLDR